MKVLEKKVVVLFAASQTEKPKQEGKSAQGHLLTQILVTAGNRCDSWGQFCCIQAF